MTKTNLLPNPTDSLYQESGTFSDCANELVEELAWLENQIAADFDLDELTDKFHINQLAFVKNGAIAFKIRFFKLYKQKCATFKEFCQRFFGLSTWQVKRLIRASKVVIDLLAANFDIVPTCEAQCRSLLAHCDDDLIGAWKSVVDNLEPHQITAKAIALHLNPEEAESEPIEERITVKRPLFEQMFKVALLLETTIIELLERIFQPIEDENSWHWEKKIERWEEDLAQLSKVD